MRISDWSSDRVLFRSVDRTMPVTMSPSSGSELGDTVDAVLQPTGEFPISGPVDWQLITGSQYPIIGRTASPDPDGTFRLTGADISDVTAGTAHLIAYFSWNDGLGNHQTSQLSPDRQDT